MNQDKFNDLDKYDVALSISSGALTAALDILWVSDISLASAQTWGNDQIDDFVKKIAKSKGYKGDNISKAIETLEKEYPMPGDLLTKDFGGGSQHHLRDFSHHPTPIGLLFSLLMQFTGKGFGTNSKGEFVKYDIPNWTPKPVADSIYLGTVSWMFHIISDIAGSSGSRSGDSKGTGVPGPLLSFLKEISSVPGIRNIAGRQNPKYSSNKEANYSFSVTCSKLFNGTLLGEHDDQGKIIKDGQLRFDLRTEVGIVHESVANNQHIPVILNALIVSAFYSVRRFLYEMQIHNIDSPKQLEDIDIRKCLPWRNDTLKHMRMLSTAAFSTIDLSVSGIKAALKNKNNPTGFALDFMQGINYWGLGDLALSSDTELVLFAGKMHQGFLAMAEKQKLTLIEHLPNGVQDWELAKYTAETAVSVAKLGTPIGFISAAIGVYDEISKSSAELKAAKEDRIHIEEECAARINVIRANRAVMDEMVSDYLYRRIAVFTRACDTMDRSITENDLNAYLMGSNAIQTELSGKAIFNTMDEFEHMMDSDDAFEF